MQTPKSILPKNEPKHAGLSNQALKVHIDRIKTLIDGESLLQVLGFQIGMQNNHEIRCACLIHGGDGLTSFRYKKSNNTFSCYSHHCQETYGSDVIALVRAVKNISFIEAVEYLADFTGVSLDSIELTDKDILLFKEKHFLKESKQIQQFENVVSNNENKSSSISEEDINGFILDRDDYFISRGFSKSTLDLFEVGTTRVFREGPRETIPIRDDEGKFVGMSCRIGMDEYGDFPKYRLLKDFNKSSYLYGLNLAKNSLDKFNYTLILTEGFTDVWAFYEIGVPIAVCSMGVSISNVQRYLLSKYVNKCIVFYDGDEPGVEGTKRVVNFLKNFIKVIPFYPEKGFEPSKYSKERLKEISDSLLYEAN